MFLGRLPDSDLSREGKPFEIKVAQGDIVVSWFYEIREIMCHACDCFGHGLLIPYWRMYWVESIYRTVKAGSEKRSRSREGVGGDEEG